MNGKHITIAPASPFSEEAIHLMEELSKTLKDITGSGGRNSFDPNDVCKERAMFVIARYESGRAIGCGAFRPMDETTAVSFYLRNGYQIISNYGQYETRTESVCFEKKLSI